MSEDARELLYFFAQRDALLVILGGVLFLMAFWSVYMFGKYEQFVKERGLQQEFREFMSRKTVKVRHDPPPSEPQDDEDAE